MSLIVNNIVSSKSSASFSYLESDKIFGIEMSCDYVLNFSDIEFTDDQGVLWSGVEAIKQAYLKENLVARIGTDEFTNARIKSLSFGESAMVGDNEAQITIEESKRLDSYTNNQFAQNIASPQWIESFNENYSFNRSGDDYSYSRSVSLKYKQDAGNQFINNAHFFLKNFYFTLRKNFGFQVDGISENARINDGFKTYVSESIDKINLSISFEERFSSSDIKQDLYSLKKTKSISVLETGFTEKEFIYEIKALKEPLEDQAENACKNVISQTITEAASGDPISIEKGINSAGGVISLNLKFTNDPSKQGQDNLSYSCTRSKISLDEEYALNLEFSSVGKNQEERFKRVKQFWSSFSGAKVKVEGLFDINREIFEKSNSVTFAKTSGKISQSIVFTTDEAYDSTQIPDGILKIEKNISDTPQINRSSVVFDLIAEPKSEVAIKIEEMTIGAATITITAVAKQSKGMWFPVDFLKSILIQHESDIVSDQISYDSSAGSATRVINYTYTQ